MDMHKHNTKRHALSSTTNLLRFLLSALVIAVFPTGCSDEEEPSTTAIRYDSESHTIEVQFQQDDPRYVVTCTDYLKAYRVENGHRGDLIGSGFDRADIWKGYFLDGTFVPPEFNEGCDILSCMAIEDANGSIPLVEYFLMGTRALTAEEKSAAEAIFPDGFTVPNEVNEYTTGIYAGPVEVELTYFTTDTCDAYETASMTETHTVSAQ